MKLSLSDQKILLQDILDSYKQLIGLELLERTNQENDFDLIQNADFILVAHGNEIDPIFNFVNKAGLLLWEMTEDEFCNLESRKSANLDKREEREKLMNSVKEKGFYIGYEGIRASKSGREFWIKNVNVWNVYNSDNHFIGQAATYNKWEYLK